MEHKTWTIFHKNPESVYPWDNEPDKEQWTDEKTGFPCMYLRNRYGALCGYVGVTPGHPLYGEEYDEADDAVEVHGGVTYADYCQEDTHEPKELLICHVPEPGEPDDVFWVGFDCNHFGDYAPFQDDGIRPIPDLIRGVYRDVDYVKAECAQLAWQLKELEVTA